MPLEIFRGRLTSSLGFEAEKYSNNNIKYGISYNLKNPLVAHLDILELHKKGRNESL